MLKLFHGNQRCLTRGSQDKVAFSGLCPAAFTIMTRHLLFDAARSSGTANPATCAPCRDDVLSGTENDAEYT